MVVLNEIGYLGTDYLGVPYLGVLKEGAMGSQVTFNTGASLGAQVVGTVFQEAAKGIEVRTSNFPHLLCPSANAYLAEPYLTTAYLGPRICVAGGAQVKVIRQSGNGTQVKAAIYNTNNLRIMCSFPSRGNGSNWTASSTEPSSSGSFDILNVNSDITEQIWSSAVGVTSGILLDCDGGVGNSIFLDTLAFINHNMTTSASVVLFGSDNPGHSPTGVTINLPQAEGSTIYIAPELPTTGYQYWRIAIDDITNPDGMISIGTIVFGDSLIFHNECFIDTVKKTRVNYVDSVFTEAFSNVRNDRGIKNKVKLTFKNIKFNGGNWDNLEEVFEDARTILKCLWIPTPEFPYRFFTFAKLTKIPEETHNVKGEFHDFVNFVIETDESL